MKQFFYLLPLICALLVVGPIEAKKKKYPNGDYYEGEWKKGAPHGIGTMKYANGDVYTGNWELGEKNGHGILKYKNGDTYDGNWVRGLKSGRGILKYRNGDTYDGNWELGKKNGYGILKYANGDIYDGNWIKGIRSGQGIMKYTDNKSEKGIWEKDYLFDGFYEKKIILGIVQISISKGKPTVKKINSKYGWVYLGEIKNDLPYKSGIVTSEKQMEEIIICDDWGFIVNKNSNDTIVKNKLIYERIEEDPIIFNAWVKSMFNQKYLIEKELAKKKAEEKRLAKEAEEKQRAIHMARHEENVRQQRIKDNKIWAQQLPYYIWEATDIRSAYENNPARFRSLTQNKYVIIGGTIAEIDESKNFEYSQLWQDWVEYKYYTIRLSGGVYFESRDAEFVSNLNRGQELLFVCSYTDEQSFNRPLFDLRMYAGSTQGIIKLLLEDGISLSKLVKR